MPESTERPPLYECPQYKILEDAGGDSAVIHSRKREFCREDLRLAKVVEGIQFTFSARPYQIGIYKGAAFSWEEVIENLRGFLDPIHLTATEETTTIDPA